MNKIGAVGWGGGGVQPAMPNPLWLSELPPAFQAFQQRSEEDDAYEERPFSMFPCKTTNAWLCDILIFKLNCKSVLFQPFGDPSRVPAASRSFYDLLKS